LEATELQEETLIDRQRTRLSVFKGCGTPEFLPLRLSPWSFDSSKHRELFSLSGVGLHTVLANRYAQTTIDDFRLGAERIVALCQQQPVKVIA